MFGLLLAAVEAAYRAPEPDAALAAARAALAGLPPADLLRVAGALALVAAKAGRPDVAEWVERQRFDLAWWTP